MHEPHVDRTEAPGRVWWRSVSEGAGDLMGPSPAMHELRVYGNDRHRVMTHRATL